MGYAIVQPIDLTGIARTSDLDPLAKEATLVPKAAEGSVVVRALEATAAIARRRRLYRGTVSFSTTQTSATATLSPSLTDLARADARILGSSFSPGVNPQAAGVALAAATATLRITDAATLTITRQGTAGNEVSGTVDFEVTEWL